MIVVSDLTEKKYSKLSYMIVYCFYGHSIKDIDTFEGIMYFSFHFLLLAHLQRKTQNSIFKCNLVVIENTTDKGFWSFHMGTYTNV